MGDSQSRQRNERTVTQPEENATNAEEKKENWFDKMKRICFPRGTLTGSMHAPPCFPVEKILENRQ